MIIIYRRSVISQHSQIKMDDTRTLSREVEATLIPQGTPMSLPEGETVTITHRLGGNFTVMTHNGMFRIKGVDGDALGEDVTEAAASDDEHDEMPDGMWVHELEEILGERACVLRLRVKSVGTPGRRRLGAERAAASRHKEEATQLREGLEIGAAEIADAAAPHEGRQLRAARRKRPDALEAPRPFVAQAAVEAPAGATELGETTPVFDHFCGVGMLGYSAERSRRRRTRSPGTTNPRRPNWA